MLSNHPQEGSMSQILFGVAEWMLRYRCGSLTVNHRNVSFQGATLR